MTDSTSPVGPGDVLAGKYRVERVLGRGGMGVVVAAHAHAAQPAGGDQVPAAQVASPPEVVARFLREARAAVRIKSEHVARVLDVGTLERGRSLHGHGVPRGRGPLAVLLERAAAAACRTRSATCSRPARPSPRRTRGHRPPRLKPGNLFLAQAADGSPSSRCSTSASPRCPATATEHGAHQDGPVMGSPLYMSPEQMRRRATSTPARTSGRSASSSTRCSRPGLPFGGETMAMLIVAVLQNPHMAIRATRERRPAGAPGGDPIAAWTRPGRRFANVAELARALCPFGPPRCEQSLERIEHVLALGGRAPRCVAVRARRTSTRRPCWPPPGAARRATPSSGSARWPPPAAPPRTVSSGRAVDRDRALAALAVAAVAVVHFLRPAQVSPPIGREPRSRRSRRRPRPRWSCSPRSRSPPRRRPRR